MIIGDVMDQLSTQLDLIDGLRVKAYDADDIEVPAALVTLPTDINYLVTDMRGMAKLFLTVIVLVAADGDRTRRQLITPYADGIGPKSVIDVLERGSYMAMDTVAVERGGFRFYLFNQIKYLGIGFSVTVTGRGK